jgi:Flp pilus assembly pilin Flp
MRNATESSEARVRNGLSRTAWLFAGDCSASTTTEYAIMTFIAIAVIVAVNQLGGTVAGKYDSVVAAFN